LQLVLRGEYFIASDAPFIEYTSNAVYLEDGDGSDRLHKSMSVRKIKDDSVVTPDIQEL
jgi:glucosamine--fructose-6-phosphate aminotransferase (isomerizing)